MGIVIVKTVEPGMSYILSIGSKQCVGIYIFKNNMQL